MQLHKTALAIEIAFIFPMMNINGTKGKRTLSWQMIETTIPNSHFVNFGTI